MYWDLAHGVEQSFGGNRLAFSEYSHRSLTIGCRGVRRELSAFMAFAKSVPHALGGEPIGITAFSWTALHVPSPRNAGCDRSLHQYNAL